MIIPVLTIAIPTYKRAYYLAILLEQLHKEVCFLEQPDVIEVLVSDNASPDSTQEVVNTAAHRGLKINYIRNEKNLDSDRNIAQCFNIASGQYVLIMGDDDVLFDGMLSKLLNKLKETSPSVIFLRAYGYDSDFRSESPGLNGHWVTYKNVNDFLIRAGAQITLISACVLNKQLIEPLDANLFVGSNLVQVHLVLRILLKSHCAMSYEGYAIACKRNNSGGYSYAQVFVKNLSEILDSYQFYGLSLKTISSFEARLLKSHHPYYVWRQLQYDSDQLECSKKYFDDRYFGRWEYSVFIRPMFILPKPLAWLWGIVTIILGRIFFGGDIRRGFFFIINRFSHASRNFFL